MRLLSIVFSLALLVLLPTVTAGDLYVMRVDGLACPYCAYGIEKLLERRDEVEPGSIDIRLEEGLVIVRLLDGRHIDDATLEQLLADAGFTLRSVERRSGADARDR